MKEEMLADHNIVKLKKFACIFFGSLGNVEIFSKKSENRQLLEAD